MTDKKQSLVVAMAKKFEMEPSKFAETIKKTAMPSDATDEQFAAFLMVAREYNLNPLIREIYAFPGKKGNVQTIVGVDGWVKIMNAHPQFDGINFVDHFDDKGNIHSVTATIHRKDRSEPTVISEYFSECNTGTEPWRKFKTRMLRHKALMQCCRYAFGYTNILDPDEVVDYSNEKESAGLTADEINQRIRKTIDGEVVHVDESQNGKLQPQAEPSLDSATTPQAKALDQQDKPSETITGAEEEKKPLSGDALLLMINTAQTSENLDTACDLIKNLAVKDRLPCMQAAKVKRAELEG